VTNDQRLLRVNRPRLVRLVEATLASEAVKSADISVAVVDDARIHAINRDYLGHDYPTDVISFLLESKGPRARAGGSELRGEGKSLGGEIIISAETAVQMAAEYRWPPVHELSLYLVHGLLHLCGYNDLTAEEQRSMRNREVEVLGQWKIVPHYVA
jgi:probable rRNA maturation factor